MSNSERSSYEKQQRQMRDGGDNPGATRPASRDRSLRLDKIVQGSQETKRLLEAPHDPSRPSSSQSRISETSSAFSSTSELSRVLGALSRGSDQSASHDEDAGQLAEQLQKSGLQLDFPKATIGSGDQSPSELLS